MKNNNLTRLNNFSLEICILPDDGTFARPKHVTKTGKQSVVL
jgi:hypothetical protein